jgi:hypothetical protein
MNRTRKPKKHKNQHAYKKNKKTTKYYLKLYFLEIFLIQLNSKQVTLKNM